MYGHIAFFMWIVDVIIGVFVLFLLAMIRREETEDIKYIDQMLLFTSCILIFCVLYTIFSYRQIGFNLYIASWILRCVDCMASTLIVLSWIFVVSKINSEISSFLSVKIQLYVCLVLETMISVFFMRTDYQIENIYIMYLYRILMIYETILCIAAMLLAVYRVNRLKQKITGYKVYMVVSVLLAIFKLDEAIVDWNIFYDRYDIFKFGPQPINIQIFIFFILLCFITVYTFRLYIKIINNSSEDVTEILDYIMIEYRLTHKEREVVELMYKRMSNEEIAKKLFISINTVKSHVKNIYSKMNINSRTQFAAVIDIKNIELSNKSL